MSKQIGQADRHRVAKPEKPLYLLAKRKILSMIEEGVFPAGSQLPSETELAQILGVSRVTLREALKSLAEEGVVTAIQGKGTFVNGDWLFTHRVLNKLQSTGEMARSFRLGVVHRLLSFTESEADDLVSRQLDVSVGAPIVTLERLWYQGEVPIIYSVDSFSRSVVPVDTIDPALFSSGDFSLFAFLEENAASSISHGIATISPVLDIGFVCPDLADHGESAYLLLEQVHYLSSGSPVLYCRDYLRGDSFSLRVFRKR